MNKLLTFCLVILSIQSYSQNSKYEKWQTPSYFRGYNVLFENPKSQKDFTKFRKYGGNLFQIGTKGFVNEDAPYDTNTANIAGTDQLVSYCRAAGIYYTICVRSGPGAYDTYLESSGQSGESRIWTQSNTAEQNLYGDMLKMITERYKDDTLFVAINIMVEPRPKVREIPANTSGLYKFFLETVHNIHMDVIFNTWITSIRTVDSTLPLIVQSFAYSTPELFPAYELNDDYLIYEAHMYQPNEFTKAEVPYSVTYPGVYMNITNLGPMLYNAESIRETIYGKVREFETQTGFPLIIGEGGMFLPQNGGEQYVADILQPCLDWGWHFALWDWRRGPSQQWNIELFEGDNHAHWLEVLKRFNGPPAPQLSVPLNNTVNVSLTPMLGWDIVTEYTEYDFELYFETELVASDSNLTQTIYIINDSLRPGAAYQWRVRSNNPDGTDGEWSEFYMFTTTGTLTGNGNNNQTAPKEFSLKNNYPNPFNPSTTIEYDISKSSEVNLVIYDVLGREVSRLVSTNLQPGRYKAFWDASNYSSGMYFYKLTANEFTSVKKMILIK